MQYFKDNWLTDYLFLFLQHEYTELRCFCYKDSEVFVVCYSVNDRDSFESVRDFWIPEIKKFLGRKVPVILVATQTDTDFNLKEDNVSSKEGLELARDIHAEHFVECSSKLKGGVLNIFDKVALTAIKRRKKPSFILRRVLGRWTFYGQLRVQIY